MKISTLEKSKNRLRDTVFKNHLDKLSLTIGLKCIVVCISSDKFDGPLPSYFDNIPVTYLFNVSRNF